jgi:hypothetical protein
VLGDEAARGGDDAGAALGLVFLVQAHVSLTC